MWLITTLIGTILFTAIYFLNKQKANELKIHWLALMFFGAFIMILVDHVLGYEGGEFLEIETDGIITSGILLGIVMTIPVFVVWAIGVLSSKRKTSI